MHLLEKAKWSGICFVSGESCDAAFQMATSNSGGSGENSMNTIYGW